MKFKAILAFVAAITFTQFAEAGRMKDVHFAHMEALAQHLFGNTNTDVLETRNTKFVTAEAGYFVAVSSEVSLYSWRHDTFKWFHAQLNSRNSPTKRSSLKKRSAPHTTSAQRTSKIH